MLDRSPALRLKTRTVGCLRVRTAHKWSCFHNRGARADEDDARALFLSNTAAECVKLLWTGAALVLEQMRISMCNETLSVVAMCVRNPDRSRVGIHG
jgi:hypothetical protein